MEDNIVDFEEYKYIHELKEKYDEGLITEDELSMEDMDQLINLYVEEIKKSEKILQKMRIDRKESE